MKAFDKFWGLPAYIETIDVRTIPEALVRMIAVENGEVDIASDIDYTEKERVTTELTNLIFKETSISRIEYLGFNMSKEPYNNPLFRKAVFYALDVPGIIDSAVLGAGVRANSVTVPGVGYKKTPFEERNLEKAKILLEKSGVPKGTKIRLLAVAGVRKSSAEIIQANLKEIGIEVEIMVVEWAKYANTMYRSETEMFLGGWSSSPDADLFFYTFFHSDNQGSGGNFTTYSNPNMDILLEKARIELDYNKRQEYYSKIYDKVDEEKVLIPLYYPINTVVYNNNIDKVRFDPYLLESWKEIQKK